MVSLSPPRTPQPHYPRNDEECRFYDKGTPCEWAEGYHPGSFHPIHLGDVFHGRYEVIRKLGSGCSATVWLALDQQHVDSGPRYVALKVKVSSNDSLQEVDILRMLSAKGADDPDAKYLVGLLDSFTLEGPNGKHQCAVSRPMGPSVSWVLNEPQNSKWPPVRMTRFPKEQAKRILRGVLKGLRFLHRHGVVHGDLQPGNFLFFIENIDVIPSNRLRQEESSPSVQFIKRRDGKVDKWAPKYLVGEEPLSNKVVPMLDDRVGICDLGGAFYTEQPPRLIVTPRALRAPEIILHDVAGPPIDIWNFGCLLYEYLVGLPLFELPPLPNDLDEVRDDDHLIQLSEILGPLPPYLLQKWPRADKHFGQNGQRRPAARSPISEYFKMEYDSGTEDAEVVVGPPPSYDPLERIFHERKPTEIDDEEEGTIVELLRQILRHDPRERPSASDLLGHSWFKD